MSLTDVGRLTDASLMPSAFSVDKSEMSVQARGGESLHSYVEKAAEINCQHTLSRIDEGGLTMQQQETREAD